MAKPCNLPCNCFRASRLPARRATSDELANYSRLDKSRFVSRYDRALNYTEIPLWPQPKISRIRIRGRVFEKVSKKTDKRGQSTQSTSECVTYREPVYLDRGLSRLSAIKSARCIYGRGLFTLLLNYNERQWTPAGQHFGLRFRLSAERLSALIKTLRSGSSISDRVRDIIINVLAILHRIHRAKGRKTTLQLDEIHSQRKWRVPLYARLFRASNEKQSRERTCAFRAQARGSGCSVAFLLQKEPLCLHVTLYITFLRLSGIAFQMDRRDEADSVSGKSSTPITPLGRLFARRTR